MPDESPSLRLALGAGFDVNYDPQKGFIGKALASPTVRLAHKEAQGDGIPTGQGYRGVDMSDKKLTQAEAPALLVSFVYLEPFLANQSSYCYRDWVMDSGAFSAHMSGEPIDLNQYIDTCAELLTNDPTLTEVFALDVIGDADASLKNAEEMWRQGVPAIPCYHIGEPESFLYHLAKTYPKIALGGVALQKGDAENGDSMKFSFCEQCFARVWPKRIHGFGMSSEELVYGLPFHSVDATNWELAPCAFGNWQKFGKMSVRGSNQDLRSQVKHYLAMEAKARVRWAKEMKQLDELPDSAPTVRMVANANGGCEETKQQAFSANTKPKPATPKVTGELDEKWKKNWWE